MTSQSAATLRSRYVEQAASDLQENRRRQQELAESTKVLKQEEALLLDILTLAEKHKSASDEPPRLPAQAADEPALTPAGASTDTDTDTAPAPRPGRSTTKPAAKPAANKPAAKPAANPPAAKEKSPQPLLGDLLAHLLSAYDEPRHAKELRAELLEKYPDREPTPQVVRNTLESLVAKGRIRRHKQRRSVLYSLV